MKVRLDLTQTEARRVLDALRNESVTDPVVAEVYERLEAEMAS